jgi:hypothetical protein
MLLYWKCGRWHHGGIDVDRTFENDNDMSLTVACIVLGMILRLKVYGWPTN